MANQALTQELVTRAQFDHMIEFLDNCLQVYTEAVFILFVVVLCTLAWVVIREINAPKTNKKMPSYRKAADNPRLLQTEP
jgi:hypothetical protein